MSNGSPQSLLTRALRNFAWPWLIGAVIAGHGDVRCAQGQSDGQSAEGSVSTPQPTQWIWATPQRAPGQSATFRTEWSFKAIPDSAILTVGAECVRLEVLLDGRRIGEIEPFSPIQHFDLGERIGAQQHELSVRAESVTGPAAFFAHVRVDLGDRLIQSGTGPQWRVQPSDSAVAWSDAIGFGPVDERLLILPRAIGISRFDNYEQWKLAQPSTDTGQGAEVPGAPRSLSSLPGFDVQLVRLAQPDEDSWVSMAFDPQGRVVIGKEQRGLLRLTLGEDDDDDGKVRVVKSETIEDTLLECRGLVFTKDFLFANANNSKTLYRLRQLPDGTLGEPEPLYSSSGGVGHGRNELAIGTDGLLYAIAGDSVDLPGNAIDWTSPMRKSRQGKKTSEGHLLRIDPTSGVVEIWAAGLRNPFGIALNRRGDLFTYDADAEYDMGSPWYRPTRVSHLVRGGDYGWRGVTRSWPSYYHDHPDNALPNLDIGKGSPTGVMFGTESHFPVKYREALFVMDWAYGRILAVHTIRHGASYWMTAETFLKGKPLNVTSMDFGPDGAMYFVTGGRKTQSALFRVEYKGSANEPEKKPDRTEQQKARHEFAESAHARRRQIESWLSESALTDTQWQTISESINAPDPRIRYAARCVAERHDLSQWQRSFDFSKAVPPAEALVLLARADTAETVSLCLETMNRLDWSGLSSWQRRALAYAYWLCLKPLEPAEESFVSPELRLLSHRRLVAIFPEKDYEVDRWLSEILVNSGEDALESILSRMRAATSQRERMHFLYVLRGHKGPWTREQRIEYFTELAESERYRGGAGMPDFLNRIREENLQTMSADEKQWYQQYAFSEPTEHAPQETRPFVKKWTLKELASHDGLMTGQGNPRRGRQMFVAASCAKCHRFGSMGRPVGPDLTFVSSRFGRADLLRSIVHPSDVVAEKYRTIQVVTSRGEVFTGRAAPGGDYRSPSLRLATDPFDSTKIQEIDKNDIEIQRYSSQSWMPDGLLDTLSGSEILDLVTFLESGDRAASNR